MSDLSKPTRELVRRGALPLAEAGVATRLTRGVAVRNPARRNLFRLLGIYLPERQAREVLAAIHDYKWIRAERAGCDIWQINAPKAPLAAAANCWATKYLDSYLEWHGLQAA
ncbi:MAG: hypothetical protein K1X53_09720 [Candidatus Sumerlaeaceae bacterium]|nr:hypothetical protein [Candidatus Sumerlaeaceae bacterium]